MSISVGKMRIGEVHALLRQDYPEIELSKIRYYEDKGLVQPGRSRKGYRLYSDRDVACLREAIRLAQEEFVPLRVVRLRLVEQGLLDPSPSTPVTRQAARDATSSVVSAVAPSNSGSDGPIRPALMVVPEVNASDSAPLIDEQLTPREYLTTQEFLNSTNLDAPSVNQLIAMGLLAPLRINGQTAFSDFDVRVANGAGALLTRGVDCRHLGSLRRIVEREVGVIDDLTEPLRQAGSRPPSDQARDETLAVASEVALLRSVLLERALLGYLAP